MNVFRYLIPIVLNLLAMYSSCNYKFHEFVDWLSSSFDTLVHDDTKFDFIIVGGGTTGAVLANRLSAGNFSVLLLEAGGEPPYYTNIPLLAPIMLGKSEEDWGFKSVPQMNAGFGLQDNSIILSAGKGLGGSSLLHSLIYLRGKVQGFDSVANRTDDPIWSMNNVLRYYKYIEDYNGFNQNHLHLHGYNNRKQHGNGGPMSISKSPQSPYITKLGEAFNEFGYNEVDQNPDGRWGVGFFRLDSIMKMGRRWSTFDGYLAPIMGKRNNLIVWKYSFVTKVLLDPITNTAIGVEYIRHGNTRNAYALNEIILSAGAIQSPKILMLSGIGPRKHLEEMGIPVKLDLPVGETFSDKIGVHLGPFHIQAEASTPLTSYLSPLSFYNWLRHGSGPMASALPEMMWSVHINQSELFNAPDISAYVLSAPMGAVSTVLSESINFKPEVADALYPTSGPLYWNGGAFSQYINLCNMSTKGTLRLRDNNPFSPPVIDPNYLGNKQHIDTLVMGIKFGIKLVEESNAMKEIGGRYFGGVMPGCEGVEFKSDEYWACVAQHATGTAFKFGGTVPMGKTQQDGVSVLDSRLRVFGAKNLRVIDASVLSEEEISISHATCVMIGELASDFILNEYTTVNTHGETGGQCLQGYSGDCLKCQIARSL